MGLAAVEPLDRVVQPRTGVDVDTARQRIVDGLGPGFFFKRTEDHLLNLRRHPETLDDQAAQAQLAPQRIPARFARSRG